LKFVAMAVIFTPVLLMKSLTSTPGDIPRSRSLSPASTGPFTVSGEVKQVVAVGAPCSSGALVV
jgi:hypothetical protein